MCRAKDRADRRRSFSDYANGEDANRVETVVGNEGALTFALERTLQSGCPAADEVRLDSGKRGEEVSRRGNGAAGVDRRYISFSSNSVQHATPKLLTMRESIQKEIRERVETNGKVLEGQKLNVLKREGGWYAVIEVEQDDERLVYELLERENVLAHPGYFYDFRGAVCGCG